MSDKFSFYQTEGLWGIIENASDEKQTSIKSYFGSDLIIKRLNEQAQQIDRLKQQLAEKQNTIDEINKEFVQAVHDWKALCAEKDKEIERLKQITIFKDSRNMTTKINGVDFSEEQILTLQVLDILKSYNQKELAIQELEKVKNFICDYSEITGQAWNHTLRFLNNKIKELKGEKDEQI